MKPLEFLAEVLPPPGHGLYCIADVAARSKDHEFVDDISDMRPIVKDWLSRRKNIFFGVATFDECVRDIEGNKDRRVAKHARFLKSIFMDMDGYASAKAAVTALSGFLAKTGLDSFGTPHVLSSGGGVHCYWPLTDVIDAVSWKPIAENFKRLCIQEGLKFDKNVAADIVRVLRMPGTYNLKEKYPEPRLTKILIEGNVRMDIHEFGAAVRALMRDEYLPAPPKEATSVNLDGNRPTKAKGAKSATAQALINNSVTKFETIWIKSEKDVGCGQLKFYMDNAQQDGMEPLWRGLLSWTKVCDDGLEYSTKLSMLHPYDAERMHQKLNDIKGPYPCLKMDEENPGVCPKCPFWGKVTNGLALGREVRTDNRSKEIVIPLTSGEITDNDDAEYIAPDVEEEREEDDAPINMKTRMVARGVPPKGFGWGEKDGSVYRTIEEKDASGNVIKTQVAVLPHELYVVDMLRMEEREHHAHLIAIKPNGPATLNGERPLEYIPIIMPTKSMVAKDEMLKCLASHNVYAAFGSYNDKNLYDYVRGLVSDAALVRKAVDVPIQFGWQKDKTFVYNNRVFRPDGTEVPVPMPGLENINRVTNSKGTLEGWRKFWNLMVQKKMNTMLAMCVDSFGSTLMHFSEYEGFVWHIGSTESGTGKSLTLSAKAGVWGHPVRYRTGKGTSPVAMQQRAGLLNSMPLLIDEITSKSRNDNEWAPAFIFDISEGQGKERMEAGSNKERVNNSTWSLTCTMTSNTHMVDVLTGARKHSSNGELMRMLEWTPTKPLKWTDEDHKVLKELRQNYGVAGEMWIKWLVANYDTAKKVWATVHANLRDKLKFTDEERYWHAACTSTVTAAVLLGDTYSGIINLPVDRVISALNELIMDARANFKQAARDAEDVLNTYVRDYYGKFVVIRRKDGSILAEFGDDLMGKTSTRGMVMGRIEHGLVRENLVEFYIEEQLIKQHCAAMSFGYTDFKRQMEKKAVEAKSGFNVRYTKKDMLARTDGPSMRVNVVHLSIPREDVGDGGEISVG